ncbi:hypothetical protein Bhyg_02369 [Pseudolycoriella hygida]|uniref:Uncharacterized protein n=1 Tax=Pseudolycoriella hygida TaxID=35572 RepID=A0A9Q0ND36_9DIPT|nr:hypothetical protein Bhyg_02369 [Pseudolycoriella hygida]
MDSSASTSEKQSSRSSDNERTTDSDSRTSHSYRKSTKSSTLQAFFSFEEALAQFHSHILTKYDDVGHGDIDEMRKILEAMDTKCESMKYVFTNFILRLDKAIKLYETKKPTDLATDANSVTSLEKLERNRSKLFKGNLTIKEIFDVLNQGIVKLRMSIGEKVQKSIYDGYSCSMDKKLKSLKVLCEDIDDELDQIGKYINKAIERNNSISNDG